MTKVTEHRPLARVRLLLAGAAATLLLTVAVGCSSQDSGQQGNSQSEVNASSDATPSPSPTPEPAVSLVGDVPLIDISGYSETVHIDFRLYGDWTLSVVNDQPGMGHGVAHVDMNATQTNTTAARANPADIHLLLMAEWPVGSPGCANAEMTTADKRFCMVQKATIQRVSDTQPLGPGETENLGPDSGDSWGGDQWNTPSLPEAQIPAVETAEEHPTAVFLAAYQSASFTSILVDSKASPSFLGCTVQADDLGVSSFFAVLAESADADCAGPLVAYKP